LNASIPNLILLHNRWSRCMSWTLFIFSLWVYSKRQPGYSINPTNIPPEYSATSTVTTIGCEGELFQQCWLGYSITRVSNRWTTYRIKPLITRKTHRDPPLGPDQ
jgi:hypothetical protein